MSPTARQTSNPLALVVMIVAIAALLALTGCGATALERHANNAAESTSRLADVMADARSGDNGRNSDRG